MDARRELLEGRVIVVGGEAQLFEVVGALHPRRRLADLCTAGRSKPIRMAMMAMTTSNSTSVKPRRPFMATPGRMAGVIPR
jgi:hypothetical protein